MRMPHTERSQVPQAVVHGGDGGTVLGVDDLGQQHGRGQLGQRVAESEDEATAAEHAVSVGEGGEETAEDHEEAAGDDGRLTAPPVNDGGNDEHGDDGADGEHVGQQAELVAQRRVEADLVEVVLPEVERLDRVEEGSLQIVLVACHLVPGTPRDVLPIVTGGGRGDHESKDGHKVQLPQTGILPPCHLLEFRSLGSDHDGLLLARSLGDMHDC
jgi:hypothetical protein